MWDVQLLGGLVARSSERIVSRFRYRKAGSLLAYLAYFNHPQTPPHSREMLMEMLWPDADPEAGHRNLRNLLSCLRPVLEPPGTPPGAILRADHFSVNLNPAALTCDVHQFEAAVRRSADPDLDEEKRIVYRLRAAHLYRGPLLSGFYDDWIGPEALRLSSTFMEVAVKLVPVLLDRGQLDLALPLAQQAVMNDPLSETATEMLMRGLAAQSQPSQSLRAFRQFERKLDQELGETPSDELRAYARQLRKRPQMAVRAASIEDSVQASAPTCGLVIPSERAVQISGDGEARLYGSAFCTLTSTRFFGREVELERLVQMLCTPRTRLVTLTGPGGIGKTRLAIETVAALMGREDRGELPPCCAVFVPLAEVAGADELCEAIMQALGVQSIPGVDPLDQAGAALARRQSMLLVLDNFEQLADAGAGLVGKLLVLAPQLKCLVTSRQSLRLEGEHQFLLSPLPTSGGAQGPEALLRVASVALFVDRAQMVRPDFQVTVHNSATLAQLCDQLEGIPLAVELAAARVQLLSAAHILEQVRVNRLDFLVARRRDATSRQRTLRSTLDWSYHLLSEPAQMLLAHVSVFRGGWTLEAADAVPQVTEAGTLGLLGLLRDASLLQVQDEEQGLRFGLLETVREYAADELERLGGQSIIKRRHAQYYLELAELAAPRLTDSQQAVYLARLETEHANLRAALDWYKVAPDGAELGLRLAAALWHFWEVRGHLSEGRSYLAEVLARDRTDAPTAVRAAALDGAGRLAFNQGDYGRSVELHQESLIISRNLGDNLGVARSLHNLGTVAFLQGAYDTARAYYDQCLPTFREMDQKAGIAMSLYHLGSVAYRGGDNATAQAYLEESATIWRAIGDKWGLCLTLYSLGLAAYDRADYRESGSLHEECLVIQRGLGYKVGIARSLKACARLLIETDPRRAATLLGSAEALLMAIGSPIAPTERVQNERHSSILRAALGDTAFEAARTVGHAMTEEESIALALERTA